MFQVISIFSCTKLIEKICLLDPVNKLHHRDTWLEFMAHIRWPMQCHSMSVCRTVCVQPLQDLKTASILDLPLRAKVESQTSEPTSNHFLDSNGSSFSRNPTSSVDSVNDSLIEGPYQHGFHGSFSPIISQMVPGQFAMPRLVFGVQNA